MAKRRPSGDGMVRKRDDGRWEGRIVVGHKENGTPIFRYIYADTQEELTAKLRQNIQAYQGVELTEQSKMTLSEWLDQRMVGTIRSQTLEVYRRDISNHTILHHALKTAAEDGLLPSNPADKATPPKLSGKPKGILNNDQLDTLMAAIEKDELWHDFFYTELTTGLRRGELCGLKWKDFDSEAGTLKICRTIHSKKGGTLEAGDTKTYAGKRTILLPHSTVQLLRKRKGTALTEWIFPDLLKPEKPTHSEGAYRQLKKILAEAGLPNIRFHDLRHLNVKPKTKSFYSFFLAAYMSNKLLFPQLHFEQSVCKFSITVSPPFDQSLI